LGAEVLLKLLGNYCRNADVKTSISVGVVGEWLWQQGKGKHVVGIHACDSMGVACYEMGPRVGVVLISMQFVLLAYSMEFIRSGCDL